MKTTADGNTADKLRAVLVLAATAGMIAFNWIAASGRLNGVTTETISAQYPTLVTPAGYAFAIWSLIYLGLVAFSIYQLLPANAARFRNIRSLYILSCALNCAWLYFWHYDAIPISLIVIFALFLTIFWIVSRTRSAGPFVENWLVRAPFGIYLGWLTVATLVNLAVFLAYLRIHMSDSAGTVLAVVLILFAGALGVALRIRLMNYFYPLPIAWGLTAIAVRQSGETWVVVAAAAGVIACLIASLSFVMSLPSSRASDGIDHDLSA